MDIYLELAKRHLAKYDMKQEVTYRGVPVSSFDKDELIKILSVFSKHIASKNRVMKVITG